MTEKNVVTDQKRRAAKREYNRKWKAENPDKVRESIRRSTKKYRATNLEKTRAMKREQARRSRAKNPGVHQERTKAWLAAHPDYKRTYSAKYRAANREVIRTRQAARRQKRRLGLIEMLGGKCVDCGTTQRLEFDHADPSSKAFTLGQRLCGKLETILEEIRKCKLRCNDCHKKKTKEEGSNKGRLFQTHCKRGHPLASEHLYVTPSGKRRCRTCEVNVSRERRLSLKLAA